MCDPGMEPFSSNQRMASADIWVTQGKSRLNSDLQGVLIDLYRKPLLAYSYYFMSPSIFLVRYNSGMFSSVSYSSRCHEGQNTGCGLETYRLEDCLNSLSTMHTEVIYFLSTYHNLQLFFYLVYLFILYLLSREQTARSMMEGPYLLCHYFTFCIPFYQIVMEEKLERQVQAIRKRGRKGNRPHKRKATQGEGPTVWARYLAFQMEEWNGRP